MFSKLSTHGHSLTVVKYSNFQSGHRLSPENWDISIQKSWFYVSSCSLFSCRQKKTELPVLCWAWWAPAKYWWHPGAYGAPVSWLIWHWLIMNDVTTLERNFSCYCTWFVWSDENLFNFRLSYCIRETEQDIRWWNTRKTYSISVTEKNSLAECLWRAASTITRFSLWA